MSGADANVQLLKKLIRIAIHLLGSCSRELKAVQKNIHDDGCFRNQPANPQRRGTLRGVGRYNKPIVKSKFAGHINGNVTPPPMPKPTVKLFSRRCTI